MELYLKLSIVIILSGLITSKNCDSSSPRDGLYYDIISSSVSNRDDQLRNNNDEDDDEQFSNKQQILALEEEQDLDLAANRLMKRPYVFQEPQYREEVYLLEDKDYPKSLFEGYKGVGQVSGIAALPSGDMAIFHRAEREWTEQSFSNNFTISPSEVGNLIKNHTIMILDRENGSSILTLGSQLFYLPHSIASDSRGNLWLSDVGRHQVMRLPLSKWATSKRSKEEEEEARGKTLRPDIVLGEAFVPGSDEKHFCQPSEMVLSSDDELLYVADGYCNQRIMVFTGEGKFLTSFGEDLSPNVVHSLALIESRNLICASDRENGRILCFKAGLQNQLDSIGELVLNLRYPIGKVFALATLTDNFLLVSSNQFGTSKFDLAALNPFTSEIKQIWTSSDLLFPHSLGATRDGAYVYAADISKEAYKKVFKFNIIRRVV